MKKFLIATALSLPLLASAQNLLTNGSFELGLSGWSATSSPGTVYPIAVIPYGPPGSAFGEVIPADDAMTLSPDAVGLNGVYFVDDNTSQVLSQNFTVEISGLFNVGLSLYAPFNGAANPGEATFQLSGFDTMGNVFETPVIGLSLATPGVWLPVTGENLFVPAGSYTYSVAFNSTGGFSKDMVIDRAYVVAVPEPGTYAMFLAGLGIMGLVAARRRRD